MQIDESIKARFRRELIAWYETHRRQMPWRETTDPYRIWVSEVMLQQTQVRTVEEYYRCFVAQFPTVERLARAEVGAVMKAWEGLGYYGRARNLHRAAQVVADRFGGRVPDTLEGLLSLPGVGRYTAGAILSIAFGRRAPVLDGNVIRVLTRFFHLTDDVAKAGTQRMLWSLADTLLPAKRVHDFNQGLMELGALVCTPRKPACPSCPVAIHCEANRLSIQGELPVRAPRKPVPHYDVTAGVIWKNGRFLITLRPSKGLLGGLWEFPGGKREEGEDLPACLKREIREELGIEIEVGEGLVSVKHAYSHFRITLHVFDCRYAGGKIRLLACDDYRWITSEELDAFAFPAADRKVIQLLKEKNYGGIA